MGFANYAILSVRNNRRIQTDLKDKYFRSRRITHRNTKRYMPKLEKVVTNRRHPNLSRSNLISLAILILLTVIVYRSFDQGFGILHSKYISSLNNHEVKSSELDQSEAYGLLIKEGNQYLEDDRIILAQEVFIQALKIYPSGKTANYAMTRALLIQCKNSGRNCHSAHTYLEMIKDSGLYTIEELSLLKSISGTP